MEATPTLIATALVTGAYLLGALSTAIIVCRAMGLPDPRQSGSRNPGATNVLRIGGKRAAALTLLGDVAKGIIPVALAQALGTSDPVLGLVGLAAFLGHLYPVYFGFRGGKGVATALGVLLALHPLVGAAAVLVWLAMAAALRYSSLAALTASITAPAITYWVTASTALTGAVAVMVVLLIWRHRGNIARLARGEEDRIGSGKR